MKIVFLGDSITEGAGASAVENRYVELVGKTLGCEVVNYGIGGTRIARQSKPSENPIYDQDFLGRVEKLDLDADTVVVFGGVNDYGHGDAPIGSFDDKNPFTFYGGARTLVEKLRARFPKTKIVFILPLGMMRDETPNANSNAPLSLYVDVLREVLDFYAVPYLDLFHALPIPQTEAGNEWFIDLVHPNDKGHKWLAEKTVAFLTKKKRREDCFFGLHFDAHAGKNEKYVGKDLKLDEMEALFCEVRPDFVQCDSKGHPGVTSFRTKVGTSVQFYADGMQEWRRISKEYGSLLYAHYSGMFDVSAVADHPEWAKVDKNGVVSNEYTSMFSAYVDELMIPQLKELAGDYGLDGAWVDGECWGAHPDYSEKTQKAFKEKTGLDAMENTKEFLEFCRQGFRDYVYHYLTEVKKDYPDFEVASNWMYSTQMPEKATLPVDFISGDMWPTDSVNSARAEARIMAGQGKSWDLMAWGFSFPVHYQKSAKQLMQEASSVISQGGGFQVYERQSLQYGMLDGWMTPDLKEVAEFCRRRKKYCWKGQSANDIAMVYSTKAYYEGNGERLFGGGGGYNDDFIGVLKGLLDNGYPTDAVLSANATKEKLGGYGLVVLSNTPVMETETKEALLAYVKEGGNLVVTGADSTRLFTEDFGLTIRQTVREGAVLQVYSKGKRGRVQASYAEVEAKGETLEQMLKGESETGVLVGNPPPAIYYNTLIPAVLRFAYGAGTVTLVPFDFGYAYKTGKTYQLKNLMKTVCGAYTAKVSCDKSWLEVNLTKKDGMEYIHLVSLLGEHETEIVKTFDDIPPAYDIGVTYRTDKKVKKVWLFPERKELPFTQTENGVRFTVPKLEIYSIVGIEV